MSSMTGTEFAFLKMRERECREGAGSVFMVFGCWLAWFSMSCLIEKSDYENVQDVLMSCHSGLSAVCLHQQASLRSLPPSPPPSLVCIVVLRNTVVVVLPGLHFLSVLIDTAALLLWTNSYIRRHRRRINSG